MKPSIIYNKIIPFPGSKAITIWPFVFARTKRPLSDQDVNHETIHWWQQLEVIIVTALIIIPLTIFAHLSPWFLLLILSMYYILYLLDYLIRLCIYQDSHKAYRNIAAEQEAYNNQDDLDYPAVRTPFAELKYVFKTTYK